MIATEPCAAFDQSVVGPWCSNCAWTAAVHSEVASTVPPSSGAVVVPGVPAADPEGGPAVGDAGGGNDQLADVEPEAGYSTHDQGREGPRATSSTSAHIDALSPDAAVSLIRPFSPDPLSTRQLLRPVDLRAGDILLKYDRAVVVERGYSRPDGRGGAAFVVNTSLGVKSWPAEDAARWRNLQVHREVTR